MKKLTLILSIAFIGGLTMTSCKKDYTCTCTGGNTNGIKYEFKKVKKKDAQAACDTWNNTYKAAGGSCSL